MWVCEYSPKQGAFHVDELNRVLELNRQTVAAGRNPGYVPLALCNSSKEAHDFADKWLRDHEKG